MNIVDDFESRYTSRAAGLTEYADLGPGFSDDFVVPSTSDLPLLSVDTAVKQTARGRGDVVGVTCANGNVFVATSRGYLIRHYWDEYGGDKVSEIEVTKQTDVQIGAVFVDSSANHILISLRGVSGASEVHYSHRRWTKSRPLAKLKGLNLTAVAWGRITDKDGEDRAGGSRHNPSDQKSSSQGGHREQEPDGPSDSCTGPILLGTDTGTVLELVVDERLFGQKREPHPRQLLQLQGGVAASRVICNLHQETLLTSDNSGSLLLVLIATPVHLFTLTGGPTLQSLFAKHSTSRLVPALEAVTPSTSSQLHLYYPGSTEYSGNVNPHQPSRFAWMVGDLVYHGDLNLKAGPDAGLCGTCSLPLPGALLGSAATLRSPSPSSSTASPSFTSPKSPAAAGGVPSRDDEDGTPSLAMTEYHFIVLRGDQLYAVNRVSGKVVAEVGFRSPLTKSVSGEPSRSFDGLVKDDVSGSMYLYSDESLYEVSVLQERRDMWRVYLQQHDWDQALRLCSNTMQRDEVHCVWAEAAMAAGDLSTAAVHWAKVVGGTPSFEDIALRFVDVSGLDTPMPSTKAVTASGRPPASSAPTSAAAYQDALALFLSTKLSVLGRGDRAQATMVAAWLTELYLDQMNRELLEAGGRPGSRYLAQEVALRTFLTSGPSLEALDPGTTCTLLAGYGRMEELVAFAGARGDHEAVLEYLMQNPHSVRKALAVMRKPSCTPELIYKFAPGLVAAMTEEAVDFFITSKPPLDPRRLIPALVRFCESSSSEEGRRNVLRYVEYVVEQQACEDSAVHNLAVALHTLAPDEASLLSYLSRAKNVIGQPLYDTRHALRLATERGKHRACVKLLCGLGMFEDAVSLALSIDLELAKSVASSPPEEDEALRRKLWLAVARYVVQQGAAAGAGGGGGKQQPTSNIKQAVEFLKEAGGLLKLEDILPFFPDFVMIDNFKDAICDSLERYNRQIEDLRREMNEATQIADAVRRDLKLLSTRTAALSADQPCVKCGRSISQPPAPCGLPTGGAIQPFFVFPTGLAYHGVCCAAEVMDLANNVQQQSRIRGIMSRLSKVPRGAAEGGRELQELLRQFVAEVACEDPRNGEITVRLVDLPFIMETDHHEQALWAL